MSKLHEVIDGICGKLGFSGEDALAGLVSKTIPSIAKSLESVIKKINKLDETNARVIVIGTTVIRQGCIESFSLDGSDINVYMKSGKRFLFNYTEPDQALANFEAIKSLFGTFAEVKK